MIGPREVEAQSGRTREGATVAPLVPNASTIAAMKEAQACDLPQFENVQRLFDDLHADN